MTLEGATRILAVRHGETAWNAEMRMQGQIDIPLNEHGRWQAARLAEALADEDLQAIYSSDLGRAWATAQAVAERRGQPLVAEPGLRERGFGEFEGCTFEEIAVRWPDGAQRWRARDIDFAPAGGESLRVFFERCTAAVARLAAAHRGGAIAVVAHGGVLDCLYRAGSRIALDAPRVWQLGNATINRLLWSDEGFTLVGWNDRFHLDEAPDAGPLVKSG